MLLYFYFYFNFDIFICIFFFNFIFKQNICVLNAEEHFLKHLETLHKDFPRLRIVLEHVTTAAAVSKVSF